MKSAGLSIAAVTAAAIAAGTLPAAATDGYFQNGYGARQKALAGAGVADGKDATSASLNPAGLIHAEDQLNIAVSVFSPRRSFEATGSLLFPEGETESGTDYFAIPNLAYSTRAYANPLFDVVGLTVYGNGGLNTDYKDGANAKCGNPALPFFGLNPPTGTGPLCDGEFGVNLQQMLISVAFAKEIMPGLSVGVAPILVQQKIEVEGLDLFAGLSNTGAASGNGNNSAWGGGVRYGVEWAPMSTVRLGVAGNTRLWTEPFSEYKGLFAENGDFDIPASIQAGIAVDVTRQLTLMVDYKHIWYGSVDSIANPQSGLLTCFGQGGTRFGANPNCLGGENGPGFGWKDIDVIKVGAEYRATEALTLRAGYSWTQGPIEESDVFFNTLAPATPTHHITGGLKYDIDQNYSVELAGMYAPNQSIEGVDPLVQAFGGRSSVEIEMYQFEVTGGLVYRWGAPAAPLK
ncbi:MAG: outer membrane protein transport protein [Hyphomicrobiaceae bacterium]|nr:outer membrane protein transport protein [Hyphomicrobiaceae bacterium]